MALLRVEPYIIDSVEDFVFNSTTVTSNVTAGNVKTDNLLYANGIPWAIGGSTYSNADAANYLPTFSGNLSAGNANLGNAVVANYFIGNGSLLTGLPASYTDTEANSAIDARVTKTFIDGLNVDAYTLDGLTSSDFATSAQGTKADTALQPADLTGYATETYVDDAVANLISAAPLALDTLNELANALGNDANFSTTITTAIGNKLNTADFDSTAGTWLGTKSTSNVSEGTNLYFTDARANTAIDNRVTKSFVDNLAVVANIANIAYSVAVGNVTGIGNISTINIDGNTSNVLYGNGVFASAPITYANSNVESYLPTYTGNLSPGNITISSDNLKLSGGNANYVLSTDGTGNLSWIEQAAGSGSTSESIETTVDSFTGDGTTTTFTLSITPQTINQTFVNYNGALQLRSSYSLDGANLVFSEAPADGAEFEVTTQTNVISGSGIVTANSVSVGNLNVTSYVMGNLVPDANVTYNLGSATNRWKDLYLSGNTIDLAGAKIKTDAATGSIAFVPPPTVSTPNPTALVISPSGALSTSVTASGILDANAFSAAMSVGTVSSPRYISMVKTGNITPPSSSTRYYPPANIQIRNVIATLDTPASDSFEFSIFKNGSNVGNFSMTANSHKLDSTSANITMTGSDYLIITVTSGTGAADLRVDLEYTTI